MRATIGIDKTKLRRPDRKTAEWRKRQKEVTEALRQALQAYTAFHNKGL